MISDPTLTLAQVDAPPNPPPAPAEPAPSDAVEQQPGSPAPPAGEEGSPPPRTGVEPFFIIVLGVLVAMIIFSMSSQRKEKKRRAAMLDTMKKGDKVQTVGGILGTVAEVRDDEVVVKVDENTNTKIKLAKNAIQSVTPGSE